MKCMGRDEYNSACQRTATKKFGKDGKDCCDRCFERWRIQNDRYYVCFTLREAEFKCHWNLSEDRAKSIVKALKTKGINATYSWMDPASI